MKVERKQQLSVYLENRVGSLLAGRAAQQRYYSILGQGENVMLRADTRPERWFKGFNRVIGRVQTETWNRMFQAP